MHLCLELVTSLSLLLALLPTLVAPQGVWAQALTNQPQTSDRSITQRDLATSLFKQGLRHLKANQYDEAVTALQQATAVYRKLGDRRGEARSLLNLGLTYLGLSNGAKAIHVGQQALAIAQALSDPELEKLAQEILAAGQKQVATNAANTTQNLAKCSINWGL